MRAVTEIESFGSVDADNDELLLDSFQDHEAYICVSNRKKFLVSGRKGAGKTAIYKRIITTKKEKLFTFGHTFSDYPWHFHDKQARVGVPDFDKYTHSWKYLILLTTAKIVLNRDQSLPTDETGLEYLSRVESFVVDTYGTRDPDVTQVFSPSKKLKLKPSFSIDAGLLKAGISPENVPMEYLPTVVAEVNRNLQEYVIGSLNPSHDYFICFDQLDLGFDPGSADYNNRLIGLLLAARDLNVFARQKGQKFWIIVFLRDDIYEQLHFDDKNKITENFYTLIEWDTPRTTRTLKDLMERRFSVLLGNEKHQTVAWNELFDESQEMPGHQDKYRFITDRTFLRPRDIIKFSNEVLAVNKRRTASTCTQNSQTTGRFTNEDVHQAREGYGRYFQREIDDEIHKHVPHYEKYLELLKGISVYRFNKERFAEEFKSRSAIMPEGSSPNGILRQLFEFSVLGFYSRGGRGFGGSQYIFRYKDPSHEFDETAELFQVHLGLIDILGLKRYEKKSS